MEVEGQAWGKEKGTAWKERYLKYMMEALQVLNLSSI